MRFRDDVLQLSYDMGTSGTISFNLDYSDPITKLLLIFQATNGTEGNKNNPIETCISSVDIVDGSDILWSVPGDVMWGYVASEYGAVNYDSYCGAANGTQRVTLQIPFGRYLYDTEYAFNPRAHRNPQLKITFDEATVRAAGADSFVSDSFTCTVMAILMEDVPAPRGYLMSKDIYDFTTVASGDVQIDLPTDYAYRQLMLRVYESGTWIGSSMTNLRLSCDGGKFNMFDLASRELNARHMAAYPYIKKPNYTIADDGDTFQTWLAIGNGAAIRSHSGGHIATASKASGGAITIAHRNHDGSAYNNAPIHLVPWGWMPHNVIQYNFGRLQVPEEWFDARQYNSLKLYLTQGDADAEVNVCLQQVRTY